MASGFGFKEGEKNELSLYVGSKSPKIGFNFTLQLILMLQTDTAVSQLASSMAKSAKYTCVTELLSPDVKIGSSMVTLSRTQMTLLPGPALCAGSFAGQLVTQPLQSLWHHLLVHEICACTEEEMRFVLVATCEMAGRLLFLC